jgi:hypothetical protein
MPCEHSDCDEQDTALCKCSKDSIWRFLKCQACIQNTLQLVNNSYCFFDQQKFKLIIQNINKKQLKLCVSVIQTLTAFITYSSKPKAVSEPLENGTNFSFLWDSIPRSHKTESRKAGKK